jgi:hypothetical protein
LLKAVMINGARPMTGFNSDGIPLDPPPSCRQGWGRINLPSSIRLPTAKHELFVLQNESLTQITQKTGIRLQVTDSEEALRTTLVWYDPAPAFVSDGTMINDLDMSVKVFQEKKQIWPVIGMEDRINNVEKKIWSYALRVQREICDIGKVLVVLFFFVAHFKTLQENSVEHETRFIDALRHVLHPPFNFLSHVVVVEDPRCLSSNLPPCITFSMRN